MFSSVSFFFLKSMPLKMMTQFEPAFQLSCCFSSLEMYSIFLVLQWQHHHLLLLLFLRWSALLKQLRHSQKWNSSLTIKIQHTQTQQCEHLRWSINSGRKNHQKDVCSYVRHCSFILWLQECCKTQTPLRFRYASWYLTNMLMSLARTWAMTVREQS